jgi:uncharacterized protein GlcG (DUF336 family)
MRILRAAGLAALLAITAAPIMGRAQAPAPALAPGYGSPVTLDLARRMVDAAVAETQRRNLHMAVVVVDPAGNLVAFARTDGVQVASIQIAIEKARSAATFRRSTKVFEDALVGGRMAILGLTGAVPIEGGLPVVVGNHIVGAIGVSGGTAQEDGQMAAAGIAAGR